MPNPVTGSGHDSRPRLHSTLSHRPPNTFSADDRSAATIHRIILGRLLQIIPVLLLLSAVSFFMVALAPGDFFSAERDLPEPIKAELEAYYGLDQPVWVQYGNWLSRVVTEGDFGPSYVYVNRSVNELIAEAFPVSAQLGGLALLIALAVGIPAGLIAAVRRNTWLDYTPMALAMLGICLPTFVLGPLLALVFGLGLGWLPVSGWFGPAYIVLPALTLGLFFAAYVARLTRGGMLEVLAQDFIRTARAKGLPEWQIVLKHALKGGILPVVTFLGPAITGIISGSFVVETVFAVPGLGQHFVNSATNRDVTLVMGLVVFYGTVIILANLIVDLLQLALDPRQRAS